MLASTPAEMGTTPRQPDESANVSEEEPEAVPLTFVDGAALGRDHLYFLAYYDDLDPAVYECTVGTYYDAGDWLSHEDMGHAAISACRFEPVPDTAAMVVALSMQGDVHFHGPQGSFEERIPDAGTREVGKLGAMAQVRQIGGSLYACGAHGQVYRRTRQGWEHIDGPILDRSMERSLSLNGIDGSAEDDILVVGYHGRILRFDGRRWSELDPPTNLHLERVCCVGRGEAYACGNRGTLLWIRGESIMDLSVDIPEHFWGMTVFDGRLYVATLSAIWVLEDGELREIDTGLGGDVEFYRLDSCEGMLWSIAPKDLIRFDGDTWERVPFPDNEV
ncbi:hypothetical protein G6O69_12995 [Pseudenhygromyxa sp. WMMC2535]|uniref:hypothetical protein n=1 Tax=Pseudenhygromyxa sp. WMMC2535 TaxID=2712867 RepID=UPI0015954BC2|nr:hypothetical protein [Pseudenhygromyxa sp. WMMC2535]NVB38750.1 hypothetical protein [Pseudenhygromyxa sp. WMMC2535]